MKSNYQSRLIAAVTRNIKSGNIEPDAEVEAAPDAGRDADAMLTEQTTPTEQEIIIKKQYDLIREQRELIAGQRELIEKQQKEIETLKRGRW